jgi:hypothetical protein
MLLLVCDSKQMVSINNNVRLDGMPLLLLGHILPTKNGTFIWIDLIVTTL